MEHSFLVEVHDHHRRVITTGYTRVCILVFCKGLKMKIGIENCIFRGKLFPSSEFQALYNSADCSVDLWEKQL